MPAAIHNFSIEQGSDFQITFQYLNTDLSPVELVAQDACVSLMYKTNTSSSQILTNKITPQGTSASPWWALTTDNSGNIVLGLSYEYTRTLDWDSAAYDLYVSIGSTKYRLVTGSISLIKNNFQECITSTEGVCADCDTAQSQDTTPTPGASPVPAGSSVPGTTPTPTPTPASIGSEVDLCSFVCNDLDMYSELYPSSGIIKISVSRQQILFTDKFWLIKKSPIKNFCQYGFFQSGSAWSTRWSSNRIRPRSWRLQYISQV